MHIVEFNAESDDQGEAGDDGQDDRGIILPLGEIGQVRGAELQKLVEEDQVDDHEEQHEGGLGVDQGESCDPGDIDTDGDEGIAKGFVNEAAAHNQDIGDAPKDDPAHIECHEHGLSPLKVASFLALKPPECAWESWQFLQQIHQDTLL